MGKIKVHELAKELDLSSKEIIEKATALNIEIKSHLSSLEDSEVEKIKKSLQKTEKKEKEAKDTENKKQAKKEKKDEPVIIRREVIVSEEELAKREEEEKKKKLEAKSKNVGFVQRNQNKDFNIVYRNKVTKPLTVDELFGLKPKEEKKKPEEKKVVEEIPPVIEEKVEKAEIKTEKKNESETMIETRQKIEKKPEFNKQNNDFSRTRNNYNNEQRGNNRNNFQRNNGYNNNNGGYRGNNNNNGNNGFRNNTNKNSYHNNNQGGYRNNHQNNDGYNRGRRPLDEKGIEKNIKNIMATEIVEKENVREYGNKQIDKQKNNRYEEAKAKRGTKRKSGRFSEEINEKKLNSLKQESSLSNMFSDQEGGMLDYYDLTTERGRKGKRKVKQNEERNKQKIFELKEITIPETISVKDLAAELKKTSGEVIKKLLGYGIMATINNELDFDTAFLVAGEFGVTANKKETVTEEDILFDDSEDKEEDLKPRPPVVVVMGHVDHGKTSLLDAVRSTNVIEGEAGGITQHIGAYKVNVNGREITFLDTPGHEAFTSMRARGAQITDIAILVVAADDGVMPQTIEAINHAKAAEIPIIVAVNKMDLPDANVDKIKQELMKYELVPEEWGGDTIFVPISAKKHQNIDQLLEMVLLVADMKELKANPNKQAKGVVIEARLDKAKGPIASMLVQRGTLDVGDTIIVGSAMGRIRAMKNDKGQRVKKAGPSTPVEVMGLTEVPEAGETFYEVKDEKTAKHLMEKRKRQEREKAINATTKVTLDNLFSQMEKGNLKQLNLIVKADVQGTVEAVKQSLEKLSNEEVVVKVIHSAAGSVTESDVTLAKVSNAIIQCKTWSNRKRYGKERRSRNQTILSYLPSN